MTLIELLHVKLKCSFNISLDNQRTKTTFKKDICTVFNVIFRHMLGYIGRERRETKDNTNPRSLALGADGLSIIIMTMRMMMIMTMTMATVSWFEAFNVQ